MKVDFKLLVELAQEAEDYSIESVISVLAMSDIPMTEAVIKLGVVAEVLEEGYTNGWSEEDI